MICDVYQSVKDKDHLLLCEGLHVLNGGYKLELVNGRAEISKERVGEIVWAGHVVFKNNYNETLETFRKSLQDPENGPHIVRTWCPTCRNHNCDIQFPSREQAEKTSAHLKEAGWPTAVVPLALVFKEGPP